eukprot:m.15246 g.15246  ORF g.15246 m.15246 type:complete len:836 (+) comp26263_c0_seq1:65-2572(+)
MGDDYDVALCHGYKKFEESGHTVYLRNLAVSLRTKKLRVHLDFPDGGLPNGEDELVFCQKLERDNAAIQATCFVVVLTDDLEGLSRKKELLSLVGARFDKKQPVVPLIMGKNLKEEIIKFFRFPVSSSNGCIVTSADFSAERVADILHCKVKKPKNDSRTDDLLHSIVLHPFESEHRFVNDLVAYLSEKLHLCVACYFPEVSFIRPTTNWTNESIEKRWGLSTVHEVFQQGLKQEYCSLVIIDNGDSEPKLSSFAEHIKNAFIFTVERKNDVWRKSFPAIIVQCCDSPEPADTIKRKWGPKLGNAYFTACDKQGIQGVAEFIQSGVTGSSHQNEESSEGELCLKDSGNIDREGVVCFDLIKVVFTRYNNLVSNNLVASSRWYQLFMEINAVLEFFLRDLAIQLCKQEVSDLFERSYLWKPVLNYYKTDKLKELVVETASGAVTITDPVSYMNRNPIVHWATSVNKEAVVKAGALLKTLWEDLKDRYSKKACDTLQEEIQSSSLEFTKVDVSSLTQSLNVVKIQREDSECFQNLQSLSSALAVTLGAMSGLQKEAGKSLYEILKKKEVQKFFTVERDKSSRIFKLFCRLVVFGYQFMADSKALKPLSLNSEELLVKYLSKTAIFLAEEILTIAGHNSWKPFRFDVSGPDFADHQTELEKRVGEENQIYSVSLSCVNLKEGAKFEVLGNFRQHKKEIEISTYQTASLPWGIWHQKETDLKNLSAVSEMKFERIGSKMHLFGTRVDLQKFRSEASSALKNVKGGLPIKSLPLILSAKYAGSRTITFECKTIPEGEYQLTVRGDGLNEITAQEWTERLQKENEERVSRTGDKNKGSLPE